MYEAKVKGDGEDFSKKIRKSRYQPRQAARIVAGAADFRIILIHTKIAPKRVLER